MPLRNRRLRARWPSCTPKANLDSAGHSATKEFSAPSSPAELVEELEVGGQPAVVPTIGGQAWISGFSNHVLDPTDPFANGFTLGDLWA